MTGGPSHTYWANPLGCVGHTVLRGTGHTCCPNPLAHGQHAGRHVEDQ